MHAFTLRPFTRFAGRVSLSLALIGLLSACGSSSATSTPPIYAPATAGRADAEVPPKDRLPEDTHPLRYALTLELVPARSTFRGEVVIDLALDRPRESLYLHAKNLRASSVRVLRHDGEALAGTLEKVTDSGLSAVRLSEPVGPGVVKLEIAYEADYGQHLASIYRVRTGDDWYVFSQFEAISAREAFPCFDEPRFKTPFDITLRVPQEGAVIANTRELSSTPLPNQSREAAGGATPVPLREVRFATTEKLPTYLLAFAVGPFDVVDAPDIPASDVRKNALPLRGVAVKGRGPELAHALRETPRILEALERYFGIAYPYDKLDIIAVPDFGAGAMENAGAITFRDTLLLIRDDATENVRRSFAYVQAHELAHQWFGNLVTMPWWDDIWLNEAFATWMGAKIIAQVYPEYESELSQLGHVHHAMVVDSRASARQIRQPIASDHDIGNAFDSITYSKGGAVLAMFERYLGAEVFQKGLQLYMKRHAFANATARDLTAALAEAAQQPSVDEAFFSFLEQPGVPLIDTVLDCASEPKTLILSQSRYAPLGSSIDRDALWQVPVCVRFGYSGPAEPREQCLLVSEKSARMQLPAEGCPSYAVPNAHAAGYYRFTVSPDALARLTAPTAQLSVIESMSLSANIDAAMRAGELSAGPAFEALFKLVTHPKRQVIESALNALNEASDQLLDDDTRSLLRAQLAALLRPHFDKVGLFASAQDDGEAKLLRALLVRGLAFLARDDALREELARLGEAALGLSEHPRLGELPQELRDLALSAAVQLRGEPALEAAIAQLLASQDGHTRSRLLSAIASQRDPAYTERVLALTLHEGLRNNERAVPVTSQHVYPETREVAYTWLKANIDALSAKMGKHGAQSLLLAPSRLCREQAAEDVASAFREKADGILGGPRALEFTLENIRLCTAFRATQGEKAREYVRKLATASVSQPPVTKRAKAVQGAAR